MRKTLLLLLTLALGILGTGNNDLFARPGYYKADPVLCNLGAKTDNSIFSANTIFSKFLKGIAVAPPTVTDCNPPILKDADGTCSANVSWNVPSSLDGSLAANFPQRTSNFDPNDNSKQIVGNAANFPVGSDTVVYRFANADGVTECRIPVTVQDVQPPVVTCGADVNDVLDMGVCYATGVNIVSPTVSDNCSPVASLKLTYSFTDADDNVVSGTILPSTALSTAFKFSVGNTPITWVVEDMSVDNQYTGPKTDTCIQTIIIADDQFPTLATAAANDTIMGNNAGVCGKTWGFVSPSFNDNCPTNTNLTWAVFQESGATAGYQVGEDLILEGADTNNNVDNFFFAVGVHYIVYTVTDPSGNTVGDMTMVTVIDNESPVITWNASISDFPTSNDGGDNCSAAVSVSKPSAQDNCNDNAGLTWNYTLYNAADTSVVTSGTGDVPVTTLVKGSYILVYKVTDLSMNVSDSSMKWFDVIDDEKPRFTSSLLPDFNLGNETSMVCYNDTLLSSPNVLDNCGSTVLTWSVSRGLTTVGSGVGSIPSFQFETGISTVVWTATDNSGNFITDTVIVTVSDTTLPTIDAGMDVTLYSGAADCSANLASHTINFNDNCAIDNVVSNTTEGVFAITGATTGDLSGDFTVGVHTIIFTATDVNGNVNYDTLVVNVLDTIEPGIRNFTNIIASADANCELVRSFNVLGDFALPTADNCTLDSIRYEIIENSIPAFDSTYSIADGSITYPFPKGNSKVYVTLIDASGNMSVDSFTVAVNDNTAPTTSGVDATQTFYLGPDCDSVLVPLSIDASNVADNCSNDAYLIANTTNDKTSGGVDATSYFTIGTTTVTWTITDEAGNSTTVSTDVTVLDTIAPTDAPNDTLIVQADMDSCSGRAKVFAPVSLDSCGISSVQYSINGATPVTGIKIDGPSFPIDTNIIQWFTTDNNNNTRVDTTVIIVIDTQNPTFDNANSYVISASATDCFKDTTFEFVPMDNCGSIVSSSYGIIHFTEAGDMDGDTIFGDGTKVRFEFPIGTPSIVSLTATDSRGNDTTVSFTVTVVDDIAPQFICPNDTTVFADSALCGKLITVAGDNSIMGAAIQENCGVDTITATYGAANNPFDPTLQRNFPVGSTPVTVMVTDNSGNTTTCSFVITVVDNAGPVVANFPNDTVVTTLPNECAREVYWIEPTAYDACDGNSFTVTKSAISGQDFEIGTTTVTYTFKDGSNNVTTKSFNITVVDIQKPVVDNIPDTLNVFVPAELCEATVSFSINAQDNCGAQQVFVIYSIQPGTSLAPGYYTNHITVKDSSNNQVDTSFVIHVIDSQAPKFTSNLNDIISCNDATVDYTVQATDNCPSSPITYTYSTVSGATFAEGTTPVTVTATDASGNTVSKTFNVTVINLTQANAGQNETFCSDEVVTVNGNGLASGETAKWTYNDGDGIFTTPNSPSTTVNANYPGTYDFKYTITKGACTTADMVTIVVNEAITNVSAGSDQRIKGTSAMLDASDLKNGQTGVWTSTTTTAQFANPNADKTEVVGLNGGENVMTWTVSVPGCESASASVVITSEFTIPTAFTPNGDGDNETFEIPALAGYPNATIEIFSPWGASVFSATGAEYAKKGWDGNFKGEELPTAAYYYVIDFNDGSSMKKGYVSIIR